MLLVSSDITCLTFSGSFFSITILLFPFKLVIFAGACQSYFEAIMMAGANFASSPGRILIDFVDPLIVAEKVATTDKNSYVTIAQIVKEIREGEAGIGGTSAKGKKKKIVMK